MIQLSELMTGKTYPESGAALYSDIVQLLKQGEMVNIDLHNVISLPSMFLNASFGKIANEYGADTLKSRVTFHHITKAQAERLRDYFSRLSM